MKPLSGADSEKHSGRCYVVNVGAHWEARRLEAALVVVGCLEVFSSGWRFLRSLGRFGWLESSPGEGLGSFGALSLVEQSEGVQFNWWGTVLVFSSRYRWSLAASCAAALEAPGSGGLDGLVVIQTAWLGIIEYSVRGRGEALLLGWSSARSWSGDQ